MTKYSVAIDVAVLGDDGLAVQAGWIAVYNENPETREYTCVNNEYLPLGVGLPAHGHTDAPTLPANDEKAVRRNADGTAWEIVDDLRGKEAYHTDTSQPEKVSFIGELPATLTLQAPQTVYDKWNGSKWVTDKALQQAAATQEAEEKKTRLLNTAAAKIAPLADAVDTGMASDDESALLTAWKTYRVLLSRIDTSKAPDIEWPIAPE